MSKEEDLQTLARPALRWITRWLEWQGRVAADMSGWRKPDYVEYLASKLTRNEVNELLKSYDGHAPPHFESRTLARVLGPPQKEVMLTLASKDDLRRVMNKLDKSGRVAIPWRTMTADELRDYLRSKCSRDELAGLAGLLAIAETGATHSVAAEGITPSPTVSDRMKRSEAARKANMNRDGSAAARKAWETRRRNSPAETAPGMLRLFDKYEVVERLTPGGMAEVFKARVASTRETVFVKRVRLDSHDAKSLRREAQIYGKLAFHEFEHVLAVHAVERDSEHMALVSDFADGGSLSQRVRKEGLPVAEVKSIALQIGTGLVELHELSIVHRDLKPENILLHRGVWKLADFGIAKNTRVHATTTFQRAGTQGYGAPEQMDGSEASSSADVYSLGKVLTFMLTGQTDTDRVHAAAWRALIFRCTERRPDSRPSSADVLAEIGRMIV